MHKKASVILFLSFFILGNDKTSDNFFFHLSGFSQNINTGVAISEKQKKLFLASYPDKQWTQQIYTAINLFFKNENFAFLNQIKQLEIDHPLYKQTILWFLSHLERAFKEINTIETLEEYYNFAYLITQVHLKIISPSTDDKKFLITFCNLASNLIVEFFHDKNDELLGINELKKVLQIYRGSVDYTNEIILLNKSLIKQMVKNPEFTLDEQEKISLERYKKFFYDSIEWQNFDFVYFRSLNQVLLVHLFLKEQQDLDKLLVAKEGPFTTFIRNFKSERRRRNALVQDFLMLKALNFYNQYLIEEDFENKKTLLINVAKHLFVAKDAYGILVFRNPNHPLFYEIVKEELEEEFELSPSPYPLTQKEIISQAFKDYEDTKSIKSLEKIFFFQASKTPLNILGIIARVLIQEYLAREDIENSRRVVYEIIDINKKNEKNDLSLNKSISENIKEFLFALDRKKKSLKSNQQIAKISIEIENLKNLSKELNEKSNEFFIKDEIEKLSENVSNLRKNITLDERVKLLINNLDRLLQEKNLLPVFEITLNYLKGLIYDKTNELKIALLFYNKTLQLIEGGKISNKELKSQIEYLILYKKYQTQTNKSDLIEPFYLLAKKLNKYTQEEVDFGKRKKYLNLAKSAYLLSFMLQKKDLTRSKELLTKFLERTKKALRIYDKFEPKFRRILIARLKAYRYTKESLIEGKDFVQNFEDALIILKRENKERSNNDVIQQLAYEIIILGLKVRRYEDVSNALDIWLSVGTNRNTIESFIYAISVLLKSDEFIKNQKKALYRSTTQILKNLQNSPSNAKLKKQITYIKFFQSKANFLYGTRAQRELSKQFFDDTIREGRAGTIEACETLADYYIENKQSRKALDYLNNITRYLSESSKPKNIKKVYNAQIKKLRIFTNLSTENYLKQAFIIASKFRLRNLTKSEEINKLIADGYYFWFIVAKKLGVKKSNIKSEKKLFAKKFPNSKHMKKLGLVKINSIYKN